MPSTAGSSPRLSTMVTRELILKHIADGLSYAQIGRKVFLEADTVKHHARIMRNAFGAKTNAEMVAIAFRYGELT